MLELIVGVAILIAAIVVFRVATRGGGTVRLDDSYDLSEGPRFPHRWGYADTAFEFDGPRAVKVTGDRYPISGYSMPGFIPFIEDVLQVSINPEDVNVEIEDPSVPEPVVNEPFTAALQDRFEADQCVTDPDDRLTHSHGQLSVDEIYRVLYGAPLDRVVDLVTYPQCEDDVRDLVRLADQHDVCLIPYGGGTNVSGALSCPPDEKRMIVSVDMRRMDRILWVDEENHQACVEAGISGKQLEIALDAQGFTSGHDPDSVELSTLGGWIATNASGMKKNRYGNIEDIVLEATLVTPKGDLETRSVTPRNSIGIQPRSLLFGCEGNLGIITKAVLKIHPTPEMRRYNLLVFRSFEKGVAFLRELRKTNILPASIRLVGNNELRFGMALKREHSLLKRIADWLQEALLGKILRYDPRKRVACTILMEGSREEVRQQKKTLSRIARRYGAMSGGSSNGKRGYMLTFGIAYIRDFTNKCHVLGETFETSVPWSRILPVCHAVEEELARQSEAHRVPGRAYLSYRVTQTYHTGVCIYFTMGIYGKGLDNPGKVFHGIEHSLRKAILDNGGSLSHHHGVGKIRQTFLPQVQTQSSVDALRQTKAAIDPGNVFGARNGIFGKLPSDT